MNIDELMIKLRKQRADREERTKASLEETKRVADEYERQRWRKSRNDWYAENKEKALLYMNKWREKNPEKVKEYAKDWREKNRELANERSRESMRKLREKRKKEKEEKYIKNILQKYNSN